MKDEEDQVVAAKAWEGLITREEAAGMDPEVMAQAKWHGHSASVYCLATFSPRLHDPANGYFGHPDFTYGR